MLEREDIEAVIACLGDDAAQLRDDNPEDERADNMDRAATMLRELADSNAAIARLLLDNDREGSMNWGRGLHINMDSEGGLTAAAELVRAAGSVQDAPMRWLGEVRDEFRKMADEANRVLSEHCSRVLDAGSVQGKISDALRELLAAETAKFPPAKAGAEAQDAWSERRAKAREVAAAVLCAAGMALPDGGKNG